MSISLQNRTLIQLMISVQQVDKQVDFIFNKSLAWLF